MSDLQSYIDKQEDPIFKKLIRAQWEEICDNKATACGACFQLRGVELLFRCLYCGVWFCAECAEEHFEKTRQEYTEELRILERGKVSAPHYSPAIKDFGILMLKELLRNHTAKGDFLQWKDSNWLMLSELDRHYQKLKHIMFAHKREPEKITEYCADIANIAMGIERVYGKSGVKENSP